MNMKQAAVVALAAMLLVYGRLGLAQQPTSAQAAQLLTVAESTDFSRTGRYAEVERLCKAYASTWPRFVRCVEFGRSPEGRPMLSLVVSRSGALQPDEARARHIPVMLFQGGIHAGEIDGKDAGFIVLKELLEAPGAADPLLHEVLVFVPVFNVDGHERFGRWNRPNQVGPAEMGWRTTAQNLNLNRDYMKAEAPEMQAMLQLLTRWDPILYVDLHVTDGAEFRPELSIQVEPLYTGDAALRAAGQTLSHDLLARVTAQGILTLAFYPEFVHVDDPASGFAHVPATPRFSQAYWSQHNRFAALVETHSWKPYARRVSVTRQTLHVMAERTASEGPHWLELARAADTAATGLGGQDFVLDYRAGEHVTMIDFPGYAYTREPSAVSGSLWTRYDTNTPQIWRVPLKDQPEPSVVVRAPRAGYIVPAAYAKEIGARLTLHGVGYRHIEKALTGVSVRAFRSTDVHYAKESFEGRMGVTLVGAWQNETRDLAPGSLYVPIAQPNVRVVVALLDPLGPDSLSSWGFFNTSLEPKEYMETYVAEAVAREQLDKDPKLAQVFSHRLVDDPTFAADPEARLAFFTRRHPSFDERLRLYPVLGVDQPPVER